MNEPLTFDHFAADVPGSTRGKIATLAEYLRDNFISEQQDGYGMARIDEISGKAYSGFIPHQNGGFSVSEYYASGYGSGRYFSAAQREFSEGCERDALRQFRADNEIESEAELSEEQQEAENDYIDEWMQSDMDVLLTVEIWTGHNQDSRPDLVTIRLSLGYRDAPYYRSKYADDVIELQYPAEELPAPEAIAALLQNSLDNLE